MRIGGTWVRVANPEMDLGIRIDPLEKTQPRRSPCLRFTQGAIYRPGIEGIRVHPPERPREKQAFEFMSSAISSEKPKAQVVSEVARVLRDARGAGRGVIAVVGSCPRSGHRRRTGASQARACRGTSPSVGGQRHCAARRYRERAVWNISRRGIA